jgi:hypothetical protein
MNRGRRKLLIGLGVATVALGGIVGIGDVVTETEIASAVRRRLSILKLDEAGLHAFAKDQIGALLAKRPTWKRLKTRLRSALAKAPVVHFGISTDRRTRRERLEDNLATVFLLSSDFFWNGADESRVVKYRELYDPMRACGNPFARSPISENAATAT